MNVVESWMTVMNMQTVKTFKEVFFVSVMMVSLVMESTVQVV